MHHETKCVVSHLPNQFFISYIQLEHNFVFMHLLNLFSCFLYDFKKSMCGTFLKLKHVFHNPFNGYDLNGK